MKFPNGFEFTGKVYQACEDILNHPHTTKEERVYVESFQEQGLERGRLSGRQGQVLGTIYKTVIHNGHYVKHDWWS